MAATKMWLWHGRPARDSTGETPVPQEREADAPGFSHTQP